MPQLPVHRYQFNCSLHEPLKLNLYSGSMLRGAFGRALRKTVCVTHLQDCKTCLLYRQCNYPQIFETPPPAHSAFQSFSQIPNPFVLEPPPMGRAELSAGDTLSFNMVLIGQALTALPFIIHAWQTALKAGLGPNHAKAELENVIFEPGQPVEQLIYEAGNLSRLLPVADSQPPAFTGCGHIKLRLLTPLRIQQQGRVLSDTMRGKDFLMALIRRYYLLQEFHTPDYKAPDFKALAEQAEPIQAGRKFEWCDWERYSQRQKQKMTFGGVLGELTLSGNLTPFMSLLRQGQWLHVGNKTTFGMGRYLIESPS